MPGIEITGNRKNDCNFGIYRKTIPGYKMPVKIYMIAAHIQAEKGLA